MSWHIINYYKLKIKLRIVVLCEPSCKYICYEVGYYNWTVYLVKQQSKINCVVSSRMKEKKNSSHVPFCYDCNLAVITASYEILFTNMDIFHTHADIYSNSKHKLFTVLF